MRYRITKQYEITGRAYYVAQYLDEKNGLWKSLTQDKVFADSTIPGYRIPERPHRFKSTKEALKTLKKKERQPENLRRDAKVEAGIVW